MSDAMTDCYSDRDEVFFRTVNGDTPVRFDNDTLEDEEPECGDCEEAEDDE